jgi:putative aldouronate transport system permease protein
MNIENQATHAFPLKARQKQYRGGWRLERSLPLYAMLAPAFILLGLFTYLPMYGLIIAFKDYKPLLGFAKSPWVGLHFFHTLFTLPDTVELFRNTIVIASGKLIMGTIVSLGFALLLNEIRVNWFKRTAQSITYLLNFLSWMIFGGILIDMLSLHGIVNNLIQALGLKPIFFLGNPAVFQPTVILTDTWKNFGFGAVIYLAALTGVDQDLIEAAAVDGANRWQRMIHVTIPGISATIIILALLNLGNIMNAGFDQLLVMANPAVYSTGDILDTYVYRAGLLSSQFSLGTAIGLLKSVVSFVLIAVSWYLADKLADYRVF